MLITKKLEGNEIRQASALLFREYIEIGKWVFGSDNPAGLEIINDGDSKLLVDKTKMSNCTWFGVFDNQTLVGCIRVYKAPDGELFEMEKYPAAKSIVDKYITTNRPNLYECTRVCVHSDYKGKGIILKIYKAAIEYVNQEHGIIFGAANSGFVKSLFRRIELPCMEENAFKYEEIDSLAVNFYLANSRNGEMDSIINNIQAIEDRGKKEINILDALDVVAPLLPVPIYWHDSTGRVLGINSLCLAGMNKTTQEVLGKTPYDFHPKEVADHIWSHSKQVMLGGETRSQEEWVYNELGEAIIALAVKIPMYDETGNSIGIIGTSIDITAEKKAEQLRIEKEKYEAEKRSQTLLLQFVEQMYSLIQKFEVNSLNNTLKIKTQVDNSKIEYQLSRLEKEVLYYLSLHKNTREISQILSFIEGRDFSPEVIDILVKKELFIKFNVCSIGDLMEQAKQLNVIPFFMKENNAE